MLNRPERFEGEPAPVEAEILLPGEKSAAEDEQDIDAKLSGFIALLEDEASRRVAKRSDVENRWLEDLRQYHGLYDAETLRRIQEAEGSEVFINLTADKTDAMEARLFDLLFPTDDKNWAIQPTPVPSLVEEAERAMVAAQQAMEAADAQQLAMQEAEASGNMEQAQAFEATMRDAEKDEQTAMAVADELVEVLREAKRRAQLMEAAIEDALVQCNFGSEARDAIGDACKIGFGVLKGPVLNEKPKLRWIKDDQTGAHNLGFTDEDVPGVYRVDPWHYFPDPDCRKAEDSEGHYERHLLNRQQLRRLAKRPDMLKEQIRDLLKTGPQTGDLPTYMADLLTMTGQSTGDVKDRFTVWEYTGPVEQEHIEVLLAANPEHESSQKIGAAIEDHDPLEELHAKVWFCQGRVISFALHPLDSGECVYSTFTIREDEAGPFGFGIPYIMRHPQSVLNGAYRMLMDNSGLGAGPQVLINKDAVSPENGSWTLKPRKVWLMNSSALASGVAPFQAIGIDTHQAELANIIALAGQTIDQVTSMPAIAQGEQGSGVTKTAQGMALLMNSANVSFRRIVRNYDDRMTTPIVRRFYDWFMQFSPKAGIKGDYNVQARGSSVLLVREMQANNLIMVANTFGDHPTYAPMLKHDALLRAIFRAHMIAADEIVKTEREIEQDAQKQTAQPDPMAAAEQAKADAMQQEIELKREEMGLKAEMHNMEWEGRREIARLSYEASMSKVAEALNMKMDELQARMAMHRDTLDSNERRLAVEVIDKKRTGIGAGGAV